MGARFGDGTVVTVNALTTVVDPNVLALEEQVNQNLARLVALEQERITLLRIDDEWYFPNDNGDSGRQSRNADWSYKNSDNPIRYHSEWLMRSRETDYDYSSFIEFVRTVDGNTAA